MAGHCCYKELLKSQFGAKRSGRFQSAHDWHLKIQENRIWTQRAHQSDRLLAIPGLDNPIPGKLQEDSHGFQAIRVVVGYDEER